MLLMVNFGTYQIFDLQKMSKYNFSKSISIEKKIVSNETPCFIIGEAGVNHNGNFDNAIKLIDIAVASGVDAVKFQHFSADEIILKSVEMADYQKANLGTKNSQHSMLQKLELNIEQLKALKDYTESKGLIFICTPFDVKSFRELESIDVSCYKVSSSDFTNLEILKMIAETNKPIILSSGMSNLDEIDQVIDFLEPINKNIILLHCTTNYPTQPSEVNLLTMKTLADRYYIQVGFSDHTESVGASPYSIGLGANLVEKHFTIDKTMEGPDHVASLDPLELKAFVESIKYAEQILGTNDKSLVSAEKQNKGKMQKFIVAKQPILKGTAYTEENITTKRTGGKGLSALKYFEIIGEKAQQDLEIDDVVYHE